ncbi:MAG: hypothetical protein H7323_17410 [Frankiales bacterium]|nr:hypothetical protein [Frankiales bacterium]
MSARPLAATAVLLVSGFALVGLASPAFAVCDAYSGTCPVQAPTSGGTGGAANGGSGSGASTAARPSTLPFTGGELVLLSTIGVGALVGGTVLIVAGRRKAVLPAV